MVEEQHLPSGTTPFDAIRHLDEHGNEYWSGRELAPLLEYNKWQNFEQVIKKAKLSFEKSHETSANAVSDHFTDISKMVTIGLGSQRKLKDYRLSRLACYVIAQNGDSSKESVATAQLYFAVQTRRQELADQQREEGILAGLTEDQRRLIIREQLSERHQALAQTVHDIAGIVTPRDHGIFMNAGYKGLYNGETAAMIHQRKKLKPRASISDYMNPGELAANLFRSTLTEESIREKQITEKTAANEEHYTVGSEIRQLIAKRGGILPENQPTPKKSVQQIRQEEAKRLERERQPLLFDPDQINRGEEV